jgi:hypothetical protein
LDAKTWIGLEFAGTVLGSHIILAALGGDIYNAHVESGRTAAKLIWLLAASMLICFGSWRWVQKILVPRNTAAAQREALPIGNNSDLYPRWLGARELLLHHRNPYSAAVTRNIQRGFYGRPLESSKETDPLDQAAFAYPVYVVFLLAPTVSFPFVAVAAVSSWLFLIGIALTVPLWMKAVGFRAPVAWLISAMLLAMSTYPSMLEFYMQNLSAVVAALLALASLALTQEWFAASGFLLALSTIKPQLSAFFVLAFLLWALGQWKQRWRLLAAFVSSLAALVFAGEILLPGWTEEFVKATNNYLKYSPNPSGLRMFFPLPLAWIAAVLLVATMLHFVWLHRKAPAGSREFGWILAWVAVVTVVIAPIALYNQVVLIPTLLVLLAQREFTWGSNRVTRALTKAAFFCLAWQWVMAALLGFGSFVFPPERLRSLVDLPLYTALALPPITLLAVAASTVLAKLWPQSGLPISA